MSSQPKWEVIERQTQGETFWYVTNGFWRFTFEYEIDAMRLADFLNGLGLSCQQQPGDAVKSLIACAEDALSFVVGGSGPAHRQLVTDSLRGTVENAKRLLG